MKSRINHFTPRAPSLRPRVFTCFADSLLLLFLLPSLFYLIVISRILFFLLSLNKLVSLPRSPFLPLIIKFVSSSSYAASSLFPVFSPFPPTSLSLSFSAFSTRSLLAFICSLHLNCIVVKLDRRRLFHAYLHFRYFRIFRPRHFVPLTRVLLRRLYCSRGFPSGT